MFSQDIQNLFNRPTAGGADPPTAKGGSANEPAEVIISRVLFALLIAVSLVINLLLLLAVVRRRRSVHVVYMLATAMVLPDLIFYVKVVVELVDWSVDAKDVPSWAASDAACGMWQFASHAYPGSMRYQT